LQEVKSAAEEAAKDQTAREKQSVGLEERRKHASAKAKKLKKVLADVSSFHPRFVAFVSLDFI
jgi:structural maintenance of chromosome 4